MKNLLISIFLIVGNIASGSSSFAIDFNLQSKALKDKALLDAINKSPYKEFKFSSLERTSETWTLNETQQLSASFKIVLYDGNSEHGLPVACVEFEYNLPSKAVTKSSIDINNCRANE